MAKKIEPVSKKNTPATKKREAEQQHGLNSRVYVPIRRELVNRFHDPNSHNVEFTIRDIREVASDLAIEIGNAADLAYRMRARTRLPDDILDMGFTVLHGIGRGKYSLEVGGEALVHLPQHDILDHNDQTPLPVRRLLPENLATLDEQGLLTVATYCKLLDHFTGLTVYRLRSHVRKSVPKVGPAELDEIDVGVALRDDDSPVIFPIEAKAADEVINRVQVARAVAYCQTYFPGHEVRPMVIKLTYDGVFHFLEFRATTVLSGLRIVNSCGYRINTSKKQIEFIRATKAAMESAAASATIAGVVPQNSQGES